MKKLFIRSKGFVCGLMIGVIAATSFPVVAGTLVSAMIDDTVKMTIGGNVKVLPSEYKVLNYNGYTYLPSRYVAEQLGGKVTWDDPSRTITIEAPPEKVVEKIVEKTVEVEKIVYVEKASDKNYVSLPTSVTKDNVTLTVNSIYNIGANAGTSSLTRILAKVENKNASYNVAVDYAEATLKVADTTTKTTDVASTNWDTTFMYSDLQPNGDYSGFFAFPLVDKKNKDFILTVPIRRQDTGAKSVIEVKFTATLSEN